MVNQYFAEKYNVDSPRFLRSLRISLFLLLCFISVGGSARTPGRIGDLTAVRDFAALGEEARQRRLPILLSVSQAYCPFCAKLKEEILRPMLISGDYEDKVLIREFFMDSGETVRDFAGNTKPAGRFADGYRVWVTPTLLFLDQDGRELNPRILGINTPEMYGYYVDEAIESSLLRLRDAAAPPYTPTPEEIGAWPDDWDDVSR